MGITVPSLMYGLSVIRLDPDDLNKLDLVQNKIGRIGLGANRLVGTWHGSYQGRYGLQLL